MAVQKEISKSVLKRLPIYLSYLRAMPETAPDHISATALAQALGMGEVQVRKDLALVSSGGRPKIGYPREDVYKRQAPLTERIRTPYSWRSDF